MSTNRMLTNLILTGQILTNHGGPWTWQSTVLTGLRSLHGEDSVLTTDLLSEAVPRVLLATGYTNAAVAYEKAGAEQQRRRRTLGSVSVANRLSPPGPTGMLDRPPTDDLFSG